MKMRAKLKIDGITKHSDTCETLSFRAIGKSDSYDATGSDENSTFSSFTPSATLTMSITNLALIGTFELGQEFYVDFTPVE